jgi:hypothetical protein
VDDAPVGGERAQHVVGNVADVIGHAASARVGKNHGRARHAEHIAHRVRADVRDVDEHAEAVHLPDQFLADLGQAVVLGPIRGGVGPLDVVPVGQRHVAAAELVEDAQRRRGLLDHVAALDADQRCDPAAPVDPFDVVGRPSQLELRLGADQAERDVEFAQGFVQRRVGPHRRRLDENRPVLRADAALDQARHVRRKGRLDLREIHLRQVSLVGLQQVRRQVVVRIDQRRRGEQRPRSRHELRIRFLSRGDPGQRGSEEERGSDADGARQTSRHRAG